MDISILIYLAAGMLPRQQSLVGLCCKVRAVPQEICGDAIYPCPEDDEKRLYDGTTREAVEATPVIGPDPVVEKMPRVDAD